MASCIKVLTVTFDVHDSRIMFFHLPFFFFFFFFLVPSLSASPSKEKDYSTLVGPLLPFFLLCHLNTVVDEHLKAWSVSLRQSPASHAYISNRISSSKPFILAPGSVMVSLVHQIKSYLWQILCMLLMHIQLVDGPYCLLTEVPRSQGDVPIVQLSFIRHLSYFSPFVHFTCLAQKLSHRDLLLHWVSNHIPLKMQMITFTNMLFC